jgi:hypothetical protein
VYLLPGNTEKDLTGDLVQKKKILTLQYIIERLCRVVETNENVLNFLILDCCREVTQLKTTDVDAALRTCGPLPG